MTPQEAFAEVEGLGYRLALRPGGLRLTGDTEPSPEVLALIAGHRDALIAQLEDDTRRWKAHEESLAAGRIVPFQVHLLPYVHPSIRHLVAGKTPLRKPGKGVGDST